MTSRKTNWKPDSSQPHMNFQSCYQTASMSICHYVGFPHPSLFETATQHTANQNLSGIRQFRTSQEQRLQPRKAVAAPVAERRETIQASSSLTHRSLKSYLKLTAHQKVLLSIGSRPSAVDNSRLSMQISIQDIGPHWTVQDIGGFARRRKTGCHYGAARGVLLGRRWKTGRPHHTSGICEND